MGGLSSVIVVVWVETRKNCNDWNPVKATLALVADMNKPNLRRGERRDSEWSSSIRASRAGP
jgi:hypothetical protein